MAVAATTITTTTTGGGGDDSPETSRHGRLLNRSQTQYSVALALVPIVFLGLLGCFLFVAPSHFLERLLDCSSDSTHDNGDDDDNDQDDLFHLQSLSLSSLSSLSSPSVLDVQLVRVVGCMLIGQILSCISLLYPILTIAYNYWTLSSSSSLLLLLQAGNPKDETILDKFRSVVASLSLIGLLLVIGGLVDDRTNSNNNNSHHHCSSIQSTMIIGIGAFTLVFACGSMMISFWPPSENNNYNDNQNNQDRGQLRTISNVQNPPPATTETSTTTNNGDGDLRTPLLTTQNDHDRDEDDLNHATPQQLQQPQNTGEDDNNSNNDDNDDEDDEETTSRIRGTKRLLKLAAPQVFYLYIGCAVLLVRLPFSLAIPHFVSTTLGAVTKGNFSQARMEILLLFILGSIDAALDFWCVFLFGYANLRIVRGVRIDTFCSILRQEVAFFDATTSGDLASRLNSDCAEMAGDLTWFFRFSIESVVRITGIVSYMLIRCPILGFCALTIVPAVAAVNKVYGLWLSKNAIEVQDAVAAANQVAQETFACVRTVISFASEEQEYHKYKEKIDHQYRLNVRQLYITGVYYMVISTFLINTVVQASLLLIGTALIKHGKLTGEILLAFMLYQGQLQSETMNLFQSYTSLVKSSGAGDKVFALLDRRPLPPGIGSTEVLASGVEEDSQEVTGDQQQQHQAEDPVGTSCAENDEEAGVNGNRDHAAADGKPSCSVQISNVAFTYPSREDNPVLKGLTLTIQQGKTVALVGASGCGKSTVVGLLQRYYDPTTGSIFVDGKDLRSVDIRLHRRRIGIVTQDPILFKGTILSNITYGCEGASREDAVEAARLANALEFINSFPLKFETDVGERGLQLSGGQKQRIAIARATVRKPALLLLDEATSALDAESEQAVQDALDTLLKTNKEKTTCVIVAHRLRTVRNADLIAFIEQGQVIESGTHDELVKIPSGHYARMVERAGVGGQLPDH